MPHNRRNSSSSSVSASDHERPHVVRTRKYRKHPKPDLNAPKKPSPSAYHLFALVQGKELREEGYTFEDIARETGSRWRALSPQAIRDLENETNGAKHQYRKDLASYKTGADYKEYQEYLKKWMAKEEMKKNKMERRAKKAPSPPPRREQNSTSTPTTDSHPSSLSSINTDMPRLDWTVLSSPASDVETMQKAPAGWISMPPPMAGSGGLPELTTADQLKWNWIGDFNMTLAPDPLFPLRPTRDDDPFDTSTMSMDGSTVSPVMLTQPTSFGF